MPLLLSKALVAGMLSTPLPRIHPEAMPRPSRSPIGWGQDDRNGTQGRTKAYDKHGHQPDKSQGKILT